MIEFPPFLAGDRHDRISTVYTQPLTFILLILLLPVLRRRIVQLRSRTLLPDSGLRPNILFRLPHIACCLLLSAQAVVIIGAGATLKDQDVILLQNSSGAVTWSDPATTRTFYIVCLGTESVMWLLCCALVLASRVACLGAAFLGLVGSCLA